MTSTERHNRTERVDRWPKRCKNSQMNLRILATGVNVPLNNAITRRNYRHPQRAVVVRLDGSGGDGCPIGAHWNHNASSTLVWRRR